VLSAVIAGLLVVSGVAVLLSPRKAATGRHHVTTRSMGK
jgi:hypothetical protein